MDYSKTVLLIKQHEGLKLKPYKCSAGKLTIGYGRNLDDKGISEAEAQALLEKDFFDILNDLNVTYRWFYNLNNPRKAVVCDMAFNLGMEGFAKFKRMIAAVSRSNFKMAATEMIKSKWYEQVGRRSERLVQMMESGEWPE